MATKRLLRVALLTGWSAVACSDAQLGSNVIFAEDFESGDLRAWEEPDAGVRVTSEETTIEVVDSEARSGRQSARVSAQAVGAEGGGGELFVRFEAPPPAYYSAWFLLPEIAAEFWTLLRFDSFDPDDEVGRPRAGIHVVVRRLPSGEGILLLSHSDRRYLQTPAAPSGAVIQPGTWFHVEARYVHSLDVDGALSLYVNGAPVYDVSKRPTALSPQLHFAIGSSARSFDPAPAVLFIDDVGVSLDRATPSGRFR